MDRAPGTCPAWVCVAGEGRRMAREAAPLFRHGQELASQTRVSGQGRPLFGGFGSPQVL